MNWNSMLHRLRPVAFVAAATVVACSEDRLALPSVDAISALTVGIEASSLQAAPGQRVAIAVRADARGAPLAGLQGTLRFDAARLTYVGQAASSELTVVNADDAGRGELRLLSLDVAGLEARTAVLVFEVRGGNWMQHLRYQLDNASTRNAQPVDGARMQRGVAEAPDLALPSAYGRYSALQSARRLWPAVAAEEARAPARIPGEYVLNLKYCDVTLNGVVNVFDVADMANTAVGNLGFHIILGTDTVGTDVPDGADRVVAANVAPANSPGLGEAGDANPPGRQANGSRVVDVFDVVEAANEAVGNPSVVCGEFIPGRGALPNPTTDRVLVTGSIATNRLFDRDTIYELVGIVRVNGGATLTIEAGTRIEGRAGNPNDTLDTNRGSLLVERDGRVIADGTPLQPIVMTCTAALKTKGCWGGFYVTGNAPINFGTATSPVIAGRAPTGGCLEQNAEGFTGGVRYGGCNPDDSSGVIRYVVEEYSGFLLSTNNELNGITLSGVGRTTVVDYIQVHGGRDDGLEIFGGTVNVKHVYSTANSDDSFDTCCGWSGNAQFVLIVHDAADSDKGIEVDNTEVAATYDAPGAGLFTTGQTWNLTFIGPENPLVGGGANASNDAFHIRRGNSQGWHGVLVLNARVGLDLDDAATCTTTGEGIPVIDNGLFAGLPVTGNADGSDPTCSTSGGAAANETDFITLSGNQVEASSAGILVAAYPIGVLNDFRPRATLPAGVSVVSAAPPNNGFFDITATHKGALPQANGNGTNIPWNSGWTRSPVP